MTDDIDQSPAHAALPESALVSNPWEALRQFTAARIALGRVGTSLPTAPHLQFQLAHARARNAVHRPADLTGIQEQLQQCGLDTTVVHSAASTRAIYLQRPDQGRRLDEAARQQLGQMAMKAAPDVVFVIGDGLSSLAIEKNAVPFVKEMLPRLREAGWQVGPTTLVRHARVAVGDEVAELLRAKLVVMLIGERPGLSSPDSMGIYMTWAPHVGLTDAARNCISNVRQEGLSYAGAAHKLLYLMEQARQRERSGVSLKDESDAPQLQEQAPVKPLFLLQTPSRIERP
ncbi:ethanolamine ammonia-lyase subunit EutC [Lampropedia puyangensis]|uniref:Ethanolamine ammonia-lyase small subunit n=1 Tax=Lampropedia puyangensis TaxID=1330072 RepID=A0A4S8FCP9_9BURK|nr:ethanolamine ammonia-lyase subunit EutC [Lampropedia puyangensis]THU05127.1 ethanolamine ammonia-lyase subunit EutC [Lampropedia puyangensis]